MCIFCSIINGEIPSSKVYEDDDVLAILDLSQVTKGHTLVMPKKHYENIYDVDEKTLEKMIKVTKDLAIKITKNMNAKGCNILNNNNEIAGQSVHHLHFHIIPRYSDDDAISIVFNESPKQDLDEVLKEVKK